MKSNNQNKLSIIIGLVCFAACVTFNACKKMDATYSEYLKDGEIVYVHKADSLKLFPGKNRVKLSWLLGNDTRVSRAMIFWNSRADSMEYSIQRTPGINTISVVIPDLTEGSYTFEVFTYDEKGNTSIKADVTGNVYGDHYLSSLVNRKAKTAVFQNPNAVVNWYDASSGAIKIELTYKDKQGVSHTVLAPATEATTTLANYKSGSEISYRTLFVPEPTSIDTFFTTSTVVIPELPLEQLVKSKFSRWNPAGFPYTEYSQASNLYYIEKLWDNVYTGFGFMFNENHPLPSSFTFDMGQLAVLKRCKLSPNWDTQLYKNGNVKKLQIWGSATPDVTTDFSTWTYLGEFNSYKPSGLPLGQTTAADMDYAKAGETFDMLAGTPAVRYIRVVVQETWNPANYKTMHITELTFWGNILD